MLQGNKDRLSAEAVGAETGRAETMYKKMLKQLRGYGDGEGKMGQRRDV